MDLKKFIEATDYQIPEAECLECGKQMDGATPTGGGRGPQPNDIAICAYCGHLQAYGDEMKFRQLNDEEIREYAGDPEILMAQRFAADFRKWARK